MIGDRAENLKSSKVMDFCRHPLPWWLREPSHRRNPRDARSACDCKVHTAMSVSGRESVGCNQRQATMDRAAAHGGVGKGAEVPTNPRPPGIRFGKLETGTL